MKTVLLFILLFSTTLKAQNPITNIQSQSEEEIRLKREYYTLKKIGASVRPPLKFTRHLGLLPFYCNTSTFQYAYVNKDSSVLIGISLMPTDSAFYKRDKEIGKMLHPGLKNYDPNDQWKIGFKADVDSIHFKPIFYSEKKLRAFNAENGVEFYKTCPNLLLNKYKVARVIRLNKKYRGIIEIHYFIRNDANIDIEKLVNDCPQMVSYNRK